MLDEDGTINLSALTEEDRREHFRRLSQLNTCPCVYCTAICDRASTVAECEPYQTWLDHNQRHRYRSAG